MVSRGARGGLPGSPVPLGSVLRRTREVLGVSRRPLEVSRELEKVREGRGKVGKSTNRYDKV